MNNILFTTLSVAIIVLSISYLCKSCLYRPGYVRPTLVENAARAKRILYGHVLRTYHENNTPALYENVEFEVKCSLKGDKLPKKLVNLTGAGNEPGLCVEYDLRPKLINNKPEMLIIMTSNKELEVFGKIVDVNEDNVQIIRSVCNINPLLPTEMSSDATLESVNCPILTSHSNEGCN